MHKVPLIIVFTKFDALVVREYAKLGDVEDEEVGWKRARSNAEETLLMDFLHPVMNAKYPPAAFVTLEREYIDQLRFFPHVCLLLSQI